jgi:hypothetical protein
MQHRREQTVGDLEELFGITHSTLCRASRGLIAKGAEQAPAGSDGFPDAS